MRLYIILISISISSICHLYPQNDIRKIDDSLKGQSDDYLLDRYDLYYNDWDLANIYGKAYLNKSLAAGDSTKISSGYYYLSSINDFETSLKYADSALTYQEHKKKYSLHGMIWMQIAELNFKNGQFTKSLDSYLTAENFARRDNQYYLFPEIEYNLGLLRIKTGEYDMAIDNFKETLTYLNPEEESQKYLGCLNSLAMAYLRTDQIDSAKFYNNSAVHSSKKLGFVNQAYWAKIMEGTINFKVGNFEIARDTLHKYIPAIEQMKDSAYLSFGYFYLGKSYVGLSDWEQALKAFKRVDTIITNVDNYTLDVRENYKILYNYYKNQQKPQEQLLYLEKLINFDSILYSNTALLSNTILKEYDTPKLINEKERLINSLTLESGKRKNILYLLSIVSAIFIILSYYYYRQRRLYKKRFLELTSDNRTIENSKAVTKPEGKINVSVKIVQDVLTKLNDFESQKAFLNPDISLNSLAKQFSTNSNYLSKIINHNKKVNFSSYLSTLRINHVVQELKEKPILREYTIKAIAFEVGFKNAESFTKAFYQQNGIYPSYFIKQLKKKSI